VTASAIDDVRLADPTGDEATGVALTGDKRRRVNTGVMEATGPDLSPAVTSI